MMQIAIASGKGGTGKTTVATNLAAHFSRAGNEVSLVDCDVEEPNAHFFLTSQWTAEQEETVPVPHINTKMCLGSDCRKCIELCRFKALIWMVDSVLEFPELCHGCGLCAYACPGKAITEGTRPLGISRIARSGSISLFSGLLRIGEAMAPPLIKKVKERAMTEQPAPDIRLVDCPPGATCPVVEALEGSDAAILVTEPTPFGLHDLKIAVELLRKLEMPFGVVVNRAGMGDGKVQEYLETEEIPLLGLLPHSLEAATAYSQGSLLIDKVYGIKAAISEVAENIVALAKSGGAS